MICEPYNPVKLLKTFFLLFVGCVRRDEISPWYLKIFTLTITHNEAGAKWEIAEGWCWYTKFYEIGEKKKKVKHIIFPFLFIHFNVILLAMNSFHIFNSPSFSLHSCLYLQKAIISRYLLLFFDTGALWTEILGLREMNLSSTFHVFWGEIFGII